MTTLVTGASGFLGSAVARALIARGERPRLLLRAGSSRANVEGLAADPVVGDLGDPASLARAVEGCEALFHVAADYRLWAREPSALYVTNVSGTRNLMTAAGEAGVVRIVYTSSVAVLGLTPDRSPADEKTPVSLADMVGDYKRSKFLAEVAVREMIAFHGLPAVIVNPSTPVGPRDIRPTPTGRLVVEAARGRMPAFVDTGLNVAHVDDVAAGHLLAFERGAIGERYILGGENLALAEILAAIARLAGRRPPAVRLPIAPLVPVALAAEALAKWGLVGEPFVTRDGLKLARKHMFFTAAKAERTLGYRARPAEAALADAVKWFRDKGYLT
ncbi:MAG: hopanoid-associated sugar epimerase [Kiloniellales bacterium]